MTTTPDTLITTYLHMTSRAAFRPAYVAHPDTSIMVLTTPDTRFYRFLYNAVGERWRWRDRNTYTDEALRAALLASRVHVLMVQGAPAGYIELARTDAESVEIAYFGLREAYFGLGLGKHLLSYGVARAWEWGAERVWVHTCNLDGPHALANYEKRGFTVYDVQYQPMPALFNQPPSS